MQSVFRKVSSRKLPEGAEQFRRDGQLFAKIRVRGQSKRQVVKVAERPNGELKALIPDKNYSAKYRDADGRIVTRSTGCRDKTAALSVLADWLGQVEKIKAGILTKTDAEISDHQRTSLTDHIEDYAENLTRRGKVEKRIKFTKSYLLECVAGCNWSSLADMNADGLQRYLDSKQDDGMSAGALNSRIETFVAFGFWLAGKRLNGKRANWNGQKRIANNPFEGFGRYDTNVDCRRKRRALDELELNKLLKVARDRPLLDKMMIRRGKRKGELAAKLKPETVDRLKRLGWERALIYKTLVLSGLRKGELESITIGQCRLGGERPYFDLSAGDEKNRQGNDIPIRPDLAAELLDWIKSKQDLRQTVRIDGELDSNEPLFTVPDKLVRILNRDLAAAGIPKVDERGYSVDVHAMRHSFGSLLSKGGVAPRTAQAAMRHSSLALTMGVYTDPKLLDIHAALDSLPALDNDRDAQEMKATGTDPNCAAPNAAPKSDFVSKLETTGENSKASGHSRKKAKNPVKDNDSRGLDEWAVLDLNQRPPRCQRGALAN